MRLKRLFVASLALVACSASCAPESGRNGGPTGNRRTTELGIDFLEIAPGEADVNWDIYITEGDFLANIGRALGISSRGDSTSAEESLRESVGIERSYWISVVPISKLDLFERSRERGLMIPPAWTAVDTASWVGKLLGTALRVPTREELLFAAHFGVFDANMIYHDSGLYGPPRDYLIGREWQSCSMSYSDFIVKARHARLSDSLSFDPPLVMLPQE